MLMPTMSGWPLRGRRDAMRQAAALALAAAAVCAAAGCTGGGAGPRSLPPATAPTAAAPVTETSAAASPGAGGGVAARRSDAVAVVRHYFRASNRLDHDMTSGGLRRLVAPSCPCRAQIVSIDRARQAGDHLTGRATVHALRASLDGKRSATVLADYGFTGGGLVSGDGSRLTTIAPRRHIHWQFQLRRIGTRWLITRIGAVR